MENKSNITKEKTKKGILSFINKINLKLITYFHALLDSFYSLVSGKTEENGEKMSQELDSMEKISLLFSSDKLIDENMTLQALLLNAKNTSSKSLDLKRRVVGLEYRMGQGGRERISSEMMDSLLQAAEEWMKNSLINEQYSKSTLRQMLHETANYPQFVELLLQDKALQGTFFSWVIRDRISSSIFIEYPALQRKIVESNLHIRVSHFKHSGLEIKFENVTETVQKKIVTLLIEGKEVNILDGSQIVHMKGNWNLTIDEIFRIFKTKNLCCGNLEYTEEGVTNWNVYEWGYWDADQGKIIDVSFEHENWWQELPVFNRMSIDEATRELGHKLDGKNWAVAACASRRHQNLNLFENHAYVKIFFPSSDGLTYSTLPLGKYAKVAPEEAASLKGVSMLCEMTPATLSFIDENIFYTFRQKVQYPFLMSPEQGGHFFEKVKRDMLSGKKGHFVYQIETENCAKWVQETLVYVLGEENVPNLFKTFFLATEANGLIGTLIKALRKAPKNWQSWLVTRFHLPLGAYKGSWIERDGCRQWVSLMTLPFWQNGVIYFPAFLHYQIQKGQLFIREVISNVQANFKYWLQEIVKGIVDFQIWSDFSVTPQFAYCAFAAFLSSRDQAMIPQMQITR